MTAKTKKYLIIAVIVVIVFSLYWFVIRQKNETTEQPKTNNNTSNGTPGTQTTIKGSQMPDAEFPLRNGSYGKQVLFLQAALNIIQNSKLTLDGHYGPATTAAVLNWNSSTSGVLSWANYRAIYNNYFEDITNYLKIKNLY